MLGHADRFQIRSLRWRELRSISQIAVGAREAALLFARFGMLGIVVRRVPALRHWRFDARAESVPPGRPRPTA